MDLRVACSAEADLAVLGVTFPVGASRLRAFRYGLAALSHCCCCWPAASESHSATRSTPVGCSISLNLTFMRSYHKLEEFRRVSFFGDETTHVGRALLCRQHR